MLVRFHGVRGSNPTCDVRTWHYGGNTPCVEVETPVGHRIVLDGGTGVRSLSRGPGWGPDAVPVHASWLVSHYHWDHIQGLPFFPPLYESRNRFAFYGLQPDGGGGMEAALQGQMLRPYFPVDMSLLAAARAFTVVEPGSRWRVEDLCADAGHLVYGGADPVEVVRTFGSRVRYVHIKDVNPEVLAECQAHGIGFLDALRRYIFCGLGKGSVDLHGFVEGLRRAAFAGWMVVEEDTSPDPPLVAARRNRRYCGRTLAGCC